ncbi:MAG: hypothetical protein AAFS07_19070 [Pseudomonadota bacterium]
MRASTAGIMVGVVVFPMVVLYLIMNPAEKGATKQPRLPLFVLWCAAILCSGLAAGITCRARVLCCCKPLRDFALIHAALLLGLMASQQGMVPLGLTLYVLALGVCIHDTMATSAAAWVLTLPQAVLAGYLMYSSLPLLEQAAAAPAACTAACSGPPSAGA